MSSNYFTSISSFRIFLGSAFTSLSSHGYKNPVRSIVINIYYIANNLKNDSSNELDIRTVPKNKRHGVVVGIIDSDSSVHSKAGMYICLDYPLNPTPSRDEIEFSKDLKLPNEGKYIIFISKIKLSRSLILEPAESSEPPSDSVIGVFCYNCGSMKPRNDCIWTCKRGHFLCAKHLFPWDSYHVCIIISNN